nr:6-bladed beta-propeller [Bacteroides intestinalis]
MGVLDIINRIGANFLVGSKNINGYAMKLLVLFLIISFLGSCSGGSQKTAIQGDIVEILIDPENFSVDLDLSEILDDSVEIIPLETTEECLISKINRIEFYQDKIFVSDKANAKIFVFTSEGKYLKSIGTQGGGPGEYSFLGDFTLKGDSVVIQDRYNSKYIAYDLYSNAYREIPYDMPHLEIVSFDEIAYLISNYYPSKLGNYNLSKFNLNTLERISLELPFEEDGVDKSAYGLRRYASKCDDTAMLIYPLNDTIYTLSRKMVYPSYVIHFTSRNLPDELNVNKEMLYRYVHKNKYLKGFEYMQNSRDYLIGYYIDEGFRYFIYNKQEGNISVGRWMTMSSLSDLKFIDFYTTVDNQFCILQEAQILSFNWNAVRNQCTNATFKNRMDAIVEKLNEDANPVLFKCNFKM